MQLPRDYETTQAFSGSSRKRKLPAGGYVCQIKDAKETHTKDGRPMLEIYMDIFEGEYKDYFTAQYSAAIRFGNNNPRWRCVLRQPLIKADKTTNPRFKGLVTAICDSNPNAVIVDKGYLMAEAMKNCVVGCLFREEHSVWQGNEIIRTVPDYLIDVKKVRSGEFTVPAPRLLTEEEKDQLAVFQPMPDDNSGLPF